MTEVCGYEWDDPSDEFPYEIKCDLEKGHSGRHHYTMQFDWDTRPIDVCRAGGHLWGPWSPAKPRREDISDVLMASLLPGLRGHLETVKEPTEERVCTRCNSYDNNGERRWVGPAPMPYVSGMDLGRDFTGTKLTWVEDRLNDGKDA